MLLSRKVSIPLEFVLILSGMPGVGKSTLALNLVKKYSEFRSLNQMNLLRFATKYFDKISGSSGVLQEGLRFQTHEEAKQHMSELAPVVETFITRQLEKKIPTILEGIDFYPPHLFLHDRMNSFFDKVLSINLYCKDEYVHYARLVDREKQRHQSPSSVDTYFDNIRMKNELMHLEVLQSENHNLQSLDISNMSKKQVLKATEGLIKGYLGRVQ
ncbi:MAG: AAA family ATPase [Cyclobacteriaceae bacterium]